MTATDVGTGGATETVLDPSYYNTIGGAAFALWGVIHVVVGAVGVATFVTGGTAPMLEFVDMTAAANAEAARMSALVVQFYQALLLIGLTSVVLGLKLNRQGDPVGLGLNVFLIANIEAAFIWFEVLPGHRPMALAVVTVALLVLGVVFGGLGSLR